MAWDTEGTKRKIYDAALTEFAERGPDGTTIERIAKLAGVNRERVHHYAGGKAALFAHVLREQLATAAENVPLTTLTAEDLAQYAGRLFDWHLEHPELMRLLQWEALTVGPQVPDDEQRTASYRRKVAAIREGQQSGAIRSTTEPDLLNFLLISLAGYWAAFPQVARMMTGSAGDKAPEIARRRASVVEAARWLVTPQTD